MARGLNKVMLIGTLCGDPEVHFTKDNKPIVHFSVSTTETWISDDDDYHEHTELHRIVAYGPLAERVEGHPTRDKQIYLEGKIRSRNYEDNNSDSRKVIEIIMDHMLVLGSGQRDNNRDLNIDEDLDEHITVQF